MTFHAEMPARDAASALAACLRVAERGTIPILQCTLISVESGVASFTATNTDQTIVARRPAEGAGALCLDTVTLDAKVKALAPDGLVLFDADDKFVTISQGRTKWKMPLLPPDDFPSQVATEIEGEAVKVGKEFIAGLKQCATAIESGTGARDWLVGARLADERIISTNGRQMRIIWHGHKLAHSVTIPTQAVGAVSAMFPDGCEIRVSELAASFSSDNLTLKTKVIDATYPDYRRVLKSATDTLDGLAIVEKEEFAAALTRASTVRADKSFIDLELRFRGEGIEFHTRNIEGEEGFDFVQCERTSGVDSDVKFSGAALIKSLVSLDCAAMEIAYGKNSDPIVMRPVGAEHENIRLVMMKH